MAAGADFDRGLPRFFRPFGSNGRSGSLELELSVALFDEAFDTGVDITAKVEALNLSVFSHDNNCHGAELE